MILDYGNEFTAQGGQAVTSDAAGTKVLDAGVVGPVSGDAGTTKDWGAGECIYPYVRISEAFDNCTNVAISIQACDDANGTNPVTLSTKTIALASLTLNSLHAMPPLTAGTKKRFLRAYFDVTGTTPTVGKIVCGLVDESAKPQNNVNTL